MIPPDTTDTLDASIQKLREVRYASAGAMPWSAASATRRLSDTIPDPAIENDAEIVVYTHAPGVSGIDEPVAVHKVGVETVFPHAGWRGMLTIGTGTDGRQTDCGVPGSEPCVAVDWPGIDVTVDRGAFLRSEPLSWFGTLVSRYAEMSELAYKRNRYYDPKRGQFTQADPIGLAGGLNLYGFADGDPVNFDDPFGLCKPLCASDAAQVFGNLESMAPAMNQAIAEFIPRNAAAALMGNALGGLAGRAWGALRSIAQRGEVGAGTTVYRVFGGQSKQMGQYWTTANPSTTSNFGARAGLPAENTMTRVVEGVIIDSKGINVTRAAAGARGPGGITEVQIPNAVQQVKVKSVKPYDP